MGLQKSKNVQVEQKPKDERPRRNVVFVGPSGAGKTYCLLKLSGEGIPRSRHYMSTLGIDFLLRQTNELRLFLWDQSGRERFRTISQSYIRGAHFVVFVVNAAMDDVESSFCVTLLETIYRGNSGVPVMILANKQDLPNAKSAERIASDLQVNRIWPDNAQTRQVLVLPFCAHYNDWDDPVVPLFRKLAGLEDESAYVPSNSAGSDRETIQQSFRESQNVAVAEVVPQEKKLPPADGDKQIVVTRQQIDEQIATNE
jgi:small GTP-binding protein